MTTLIKLFKKNEELASYIFFGILTTLINLLSFFLLQKTNPDYYVLNNTIAWFLSVLFAFITNKIFVFKSTRWSFRLLIKEITLFFGSRFLTLFIDDGIMIVGIQLLKQGMTLTKIIDQIIIIILNFVFAKISFFNRKQ